MSLDLREKGHALEGGLLGTACVSNQTDTSSFVVWLPRDILGVPKVLREKQIFLGECTPRAAGTPSPRTAVPGCHLRSWVWEQNANFLPNSHKHQLLCRHASLLFQEGSPARGSLQQLGSTDFTRLRARLYQRRFSKFLSNFADAHQ